MCNNSCTRKWLAITWVNYLMFGNPRLYKHKPFLSSFELQICFFPSFLQAFTPIFPLSSIVDPFLFFSPFYRSCYILFHTSFFFSLPIFHLYFFLFLRTIFLSIFLHFFLSVFLCFYSVQYLGTHCHIPALDFAIPLEKQQSTWRAAH